MRNILGMNFADNNYPDFGSITFDINSMLTRAVCIGTYNANAFYFRSGDVAIVDDAQRAFVYNSDSDSWTEWDI